MEVLPFSHSFLIDTPTATEGFPQYHEAQYDDGNQQSMNSADTVVDIVTVRGVLDCTGTNNERGGVSSQEHKQY